MYWTFTHPDSLSDIGGWTVVVRAETEVEAVEKVRLHLKSLGREMPFDCNRTSDDGLDPIVYSDVEE